MQALRNAGLTITAVSCGDHHTAALDDAGCIYTWGWGGNFFSGGGALGHGTTSGDVEFPTLVESTAAVVKVIRHESNVYNTFCWVL